MLDVRRELSAVKYISMYYKTTGNRFCLAFPEKSLKYFLGDGEGNTHVEMRRARRKGEGKDNR